jgi:hypothetical protein
MRRAIGFAGALAFLLVAPTGATTLQVTRFGPWTSFHSPLLALVQCEGNLDAGVPLQCVTLRSWEGSVPASVLVATTRHPELEGSPGLELLLLRDRRSQAAVFRLGSSTSVRLAATSRDAVIAYVDQRAAAEKAVTDEAKGALFWAAMRQWTSSHDSTVARFLETDLGSGLSPWQTPVPDLHQWVDATLAQPSSTMKWRMQNVAWVTMERWPTRENQLEFLRVADADRNVAIQFCKTYGSSRYPHDELLVDAIRRFAGSQVPALATLAKSALSRMHLPLPPSP